jgi:hypothetical protein
VQLGEDEEENILRNEGGKGQCARALGTPPPARVLPDPKAKDAAKPKHKETFADLLNKSTDE